MKIIPDFNKMSTNEAIAYCYRHKNDFLKDFGDGGQRSFDCLISIIESGNIKPSELPDYGMDYPE